MSLSKKTDLYKTIDKTKDLYIIYTYKNNGK